MATKLKIKRSTVSGVVPTTVDIDTAELAVNLADKKLFTSNGTAVLELGSNLTNLSVTGNATLAGVIANGSLGAAGQVLSSNGTGVYWANSSISGVVSEQFIANGSVTSFAVTGGYIPSAIEVYVSGVKQTPGIDVAVTSGSNIVFTIAPLNGQVVDVFGYKALGSITTSGTVTAVTAGAGLNGGEITTVGTISVNANSGIVANSTGVFVQANSGIVANSTGVFVRANTGLVANSTGVFVQANTGLVANSTGVFFQANTGLVANNTGVFVQANTGLVANSTGLHVNSSYATTGKAIAMAIVFG